MQKIRVGIIGFGLSGRYFHAPFLKALRGYEVIAVSSSRKDDVLAMFPEAYVTSDPLQLIQNNNIDLIINCAPNTEHFPLSAKALQAGKHVVVEKPFVNSVHEGEELLALAKKANRILTVFQNRRWDGDFLTVKNLIASGRLGQISQFESHFDRYRPTVRPERWREQAGPGSGTLYDLGSHLVDQTLILFGKPQSVIVDAECQRPGSTSIDYFHIVMKYEKLRVVLHGSSFTDTTPRFQIFGDKGSYIKYGLDPQEDQLKNGISPDDPDFGKESISQNGILISPLDHQKETIKTEPGRYIEFYQQLYDAIAKQDGPSAGSSNAPVTAEQALEVIRIISGKL